mgnify:CR=1 FL=1|tara:strand:- start:9736 stop:10221 length:486 start_codon:yes stop_codon:yes gene_type:complete
MAGTTDELEVDEILKELDSFLAQYELSHNIDMCESDAAVYESLNFSQEQLKELSNEDALVHSYLIQTYISKLTHDHNKEIARFEWASDAFNDLLYHYLSVTQFDDYTKHGVKEQMICDTHPVVEKLRKVMRKSKTVCTLYTNKFPPLGKLADILFQLARTR